MKRKIFAYPYALWMAVFIILPLILVVYYAFTKSVDGNIVFSVENMLKVFDPVYLNVLLRSILLALECTAICLVIGYPVAYILAKYGKNAQKIIIWFMLPMRLHVGSDS